MKSETSASIVLAFLVILATGQIAYASDPFARISIQPLYEPARYGGEAYATGYED
jgi:hypothetical protein